MRINIEDPTFQTAIFNIVFVLFVLVTLRKDRNPFDLDIHHTTELKGAAILMVLFSHVGYFLSTDDRFLFPLSIAAGIGVNIFLFLSGFGLTSSELKKKRSIKEFYFKRLPIIYIPMWIVLTVTLISDRLLSGRSYGTSEILHSFAGYFPLADVGTSINSPLWYFTFILFYYLVFPVIFRFAKGWLPVLGVFASSFLVLKLPLPVGPDVLNLYKAHYLLFPLGMLFAYVNERWPIRAVLQKLFSGQFLHTAVRYLLLLALTGVFIYTAVNSGVGKGITAEQSISIVSVFCLLGVFLLKKFHSGFLMLIGRFSYEIYLIQWPILYRHDFIYRYFSGAVATVLYLAVFLIIGFGLNRLSKLVVGKVFS